MALILKKNGNCLDKLFTSANRYPHDKGYFSANSWLCPITRRFDNWTSVSGWYLTIIMSKFHLIRHAVVSNNIVFNNIPSHLANIYFQLFQDILYYHMSDVTWPGAPQECKYLDIWHNLVLGGHHGSLHSPWIHTHIVELFRRK